MKQKKKKRRVLVDSDKDDEHLNTIFDEGCGLKTDCNENARQVGNSPSLHERIGNVMVTLIIGSQILKTFCAVFGICARKNFIQTIF